MSRKQVLKLDAFGAVVLCRGCGVGMFTMDPEDYHRACFPAVVSLNPQYISAAFSYTTCKRRACASCKEFEKFIRDAFKKQEPFPVLRFQFQSGGEVMFSISPDGIVTVNPNIELDDAGRAFWKAVARTSPSPAVTPPHEVLAALEAWFKAYPGTIPFLRELMRDVPGDEYRAAVTDLCTVVEDMHIKNVGARTRPTIYGGSRGGGKTYVKCSCCSGGVGCWDCPQCKGTGKVKS